MGSHNDYPRPALAAVTHERAVATGFDTAVLSSSPPRRDAQCAATIGPATRSCGAHTAHAGAELRPAGRAEEYELRMAPQRPELPGALPSALGAEVAMHPHSEALARAADAVEGEVRQAEAERAKASAAEPRLGTEPNLADLLGIKPLGE